MGLHTGSKSDIGQELGASGYSSEKVSTIDWQAHEVTVDVVHVAATGLICRRCERVWVGYDEGVPSQGGGDPARGCDGTCAST